MSAAQIVLNSWLLETFGAKFFRFGYLLNVPVLVLFHVKGFFALLSQSFAMTGDQEQLHCLQGCWH